MVGAAVKAIRRLPAWAPTGLAAALALAGCAAAPSQNILGSYFPSWMLCALAGALAAALIRLLLGLIGLEKAIPAPLLVYLALATAFAFAIWLLWLE